ncbi:MAG: hypothetical protein WD793_08920 [Steroidobacteraceae bacterium]
MFGLALPAFAAVDRVLAAFLGPLPRLIAWGCLMGVLVMALYRLISPQRKLAAIKADAAAARRQIAGFDGEFDQLTPLIRRSMRLSLQQITWILLPAIVASLPLIACLMWLYSAYSFTMPSAGEAIAVTVSPAGETISAKPDDSLTRTGDAWQLHWPPLGKQVELQDQTGGTLAQLGGQPASMIVEQFQWWNRLIGNPAGYIPAGSPVHRLEFKLTEAEILPIGPAWLRGWEAPFFLALIAVSILLKVVFRIE